MKILYDKRMPLVLAYLVAVVVFYFSYGFKVLDPTNINWLMSARHDWGQHYLGWSFWRNEPWTFPLGDMENYIYPLGSNMGFTDSIPLMALLFKPFTSFLPEDFQYIGIWILLCYLMVAHYTYKICALYRLNNIYSLFAVILVTINPVLVYRGMHPALCSHGFILASIYYYLIPANPGNVIQLNKRQAALTIISALITPYLTAMLIGFNVILPLKHWLYNKLISFKQGLVYFIITVFGVLLLWTLTGLLRFGSGESLSVSGGYGPYGYNLNGLFNSSGFSPIMPQMPWVTEQQYEGFMYLGLGMILFICISLIMFLVKGRPAAFIKSHKWLLPLFIFTLVLSLFAITNKITYNETVIAEIPLPRIFLKFFSIFRASGRFFWQTYYLLLLFFLLSFFRANLPKWISYSVLTLVLAVQVYDISPIYKFRKLVSGAYDSPLNESAWNAILPAFNTMVTYQPFNNHLLKNMDYQDLCFLALKHKMRITVGYSARENGEAYRNITDSITADLFAGKVNPKDLFITTKQNISVFSDLLRSRSVKVQYLDGYFLVYDKNAGVPIVSTDERSRFVIDSLNNAFSKSSFINEIPTPVADNTLINYTIEEISMGEANVRVKGWAYRKDTDNNKGDEVYITVTDNNGVTRLANTQQIKRPDVTTFFKKTNLEDSGYESTFFGEEKWTPETKLGLAIKTAQGKWYYADMGPLLELDRNKKPDILHNLPKMGKVIGNLDGMKIEGDFVFMNGWAAFEDTGSVNTTIKVAFIGKQVSYISKTASAKRDDVTKAYNNKFNYDSSGYNLKADITDMKKGTYQVGLIVSIEGREEMKIIPDKTLKVD